MISVIAPIETRIKRVMIRDSVSREEVLNRIKNQLSDEDLIKKSDFIIENNTIEETKHQVDKILKKITIK